MKSIREIALDILYDLAKDIAVDLLRTALEARLRQFTEAQPAQSNLFPTIYGGKQVFYTNKSVFLQRELGPTVDYLARLSQAERGALLKQAAQATSSEPDKVLLQLIYLVQERRLQR